MTATEYAVELRDILGTHGGWSGGHRTLGDARRTAKQWVKDRNPGYVAILLRRDKTTDAIGAQWSEVGRVTWAS